jgi:CHASE3 domain sensor protein
MESREREPFRVFAGAVSLRRRVAYSLAIVRLILVPVIFLPVYYLFRTGAIVDRIVGVDAPAATLAEQASIEMLEARRAERNYLLLRDVSFFQENHESVGKIRQTLSRIQDLEPDEQSSAQTALEALNLYQQRFDAAVSALGPSGSQSSSDRIQSVVSSYEKDLNELLKRARFKRRAELVEELRSRVGSFDTQISKTVQEGEPALQQVTRDLQGSSERVLHSSSGLQALNWGRVQSDRQEARRLIKEAEWALSAVSTLTLLLSVWISFVLPRQVVKPLVNLKEAVDHATAGNYGFDFHLEGHGEVAQLAMSIQNLIANIQQKA